jgi:acyl-CoA dehydrogenase
MGWPAIIADGASGLGMGMTNDSIVEQVFREVRDFPIFDGPSEDHKWSLANKIKRDWRLRHRRER